MDNVDVCYSLRPFFFFTFRVMSTISTQWQSHLTQVLMCLTGVGCSDYSDLPRLRSLVPVDDTSHFLRYRVYTLTPWTDSPFEIGLSWNTSELWIFMVHSNSRPPYLSNFYLPTHYLFLELILRYMSTVGRNVFWNKKK